SNGIDAWWLGTKRSCAGRRAPPISPQHTQELLMFRMPIARVSLIALSLALCPAAAAQTPPIAGSGVTPGTEESSAARPLEFAATPPADASLAIVMTSATLPDGLSLSAGDRDALAAAVASEEFEGKAGKTLTLRAVGGRPKVLLIGVGTDPAANDFAEAGGTVAQELKGEQGPVAIVGLRTPQAVAQTAPGYQLGQYRVDRYQTAADTPPPAQPVTLVHADSAAARAAYQSRQAGVAEGVRFARDLINEPPSVIYPESFVARTREAFGDLANVEIEVLDENQMRRLGMGALVGVGQGSPRGSRLMLVTYRGADGPPLALVGKGITFDSGGLSLKTGSGMVDMKADMSGAAAVVGTALS